MEEDIFIKVNGGKNTSIIFPNFKKSIKYISVDKISTRNFGKKFNSQFFEIANRDGLRLKYLRKDICFELWSNSSILKVNLDLKYFKIGF